MPARRPAFQPGAASGFFLTIDCFGILRLHIEEESVKAPSFAYAKARSLAEAFDLLERPGARILAGGQSLIPSLNMRLAQPELLVDITALPLKDISAQKGALRIGALVTHTAIIESADVRQKVPVLAEAAQHVAHPAIRNRGTLGGSLALADPAAEYPAVALALEATIVVQSRKGERRVGAQAFFKGLFETDLQPGEVLVGAQFPSAERSVFLELARRHGDYAIVGLAAAVNGSARRIAFFGLGAKPILAVNAAKETDVAKAQRALEKDLQPLADLYHSAATKLHLAKVLLARAWNTLSTSH
jgi:aerobic carbon-monoxide dehydrogenase medium subunit